MPSPNPEILVPEISDGRWLIVADTLASPDIAEKAKLSRGLNFFVFVVENLRLVTLFAATGALLALIATLFLANTYTATTQLLPPQLNSSSALLGQFGELASLTGRDILRNPSALFVVLLRSHTVGQRLTERFALMQVYSVKRTSDCLQRLEKQTEIEAMKEGVVVIKVTDGDPRRAANLANGYVEELIHMNQTLAVGEAARRRVFFEGQVNESREQLAKAEEALQHAQEKSGMIQLDTQAKAAIEAASMLRAHIAMKEVALQRIRTYATESNPETLVAIAELKALKDQLRSIRDPGNGQDVDISISKLPATGLEYIRHLRDVKYYETVLSVLAKQLEVARIDEAKEGSLIQVIDRAEAPDCKSGPRRPLITLFGAVAGLALGFAWAAGRNSIARARLDPVTSQQLNQLQNSFRSLFPTYARSSQS